MKDVLELTKQLIARPSVTPNDEGCQPLLTTLLNANNFECETMQFADVTNLWARHGKTSPLVVLLGHTDVVPPGPLDAWQSNPFTPTIRDDFLFGRGAADMKSGVAAMTLAAIEFVKRHPNHPGTIAILITSDEEGAAENGVKRVLPELAKRGDKIDYCIVGEASSEQQLGDTIKVGRRGSLHAYVTVHGKQGHVAYPQFAINPIHQLGPILTDLSAMQWDAGDDYFPATSMQTTSIHAGSGVNNVIPGELKFHFNFRYSPQSTADDLQQCVHAIFDKYALNYKIDWRLASKPFITHDKKLLQAIQQGVEEVTGIKPTASTAGGTSDGRFIAPTGAAVVELGPVNATIHKVDECIAVADLERMPSMYLRCLENLLLNT